MKRKLISTLLLIGLLIPMIFAASTAAPSYALQQETPPISEVGDTSDKTEEITVAEDESDESAPPVSEPLPTSEETLEVDGTFEADRSFAVTAPQALDAQPVPTNNGATFKETMPCAVLRAWVKDKVKTIAGGTAPTDDDPIADWQGTLDQITELKLQLPLSALAAGSLLPEVEEAYKTGIDFTGVSCMPNITSVYMSVYEREIHHKVPIKNLIADGHMIAGNVTHLTMIDFVFAPGGHTDLAHFTALEKLEIIGTRSNYPTEMPEGDWHTITDVKFLNNMPHLEEITINDQSMKNLDAVDFSGMSKLWNLELINNELQSVSGLSTLENHGVPLGINLKKNKLKDISGLSHLPHLLPMLDLSDNTIEDLIPLQSLLQNTEALLFQLNLGNNQISDLTPLASLPPGLLMLNLEGNQIQDLNPLPVEFF